MDKRSKIGFKFILIIFLENIYNSKFHGKFPSKKNQSIALITFSKEYQYKHKIVLTIFIHLTYLPNLFTSYTYLNYH